MSQHSHALNESIGSTVLGYPRIGPRRELKKALESYWAGRIDSDELQATAAELRRTTWEKLAASGLDSVPGNTFSFYDQMLDTAQLFGAVPRRYRHLSTTDAYFAMARGRDDLAPLELTKWFDTNYHYLVPELSPETRFALTTDKPIAEYREASALGIVTRPVLPGPLTFLLLAKAAPGSPSGFQPLDLLDGLIESYAELLSRLADEGVAWVQLDEPALVADRTPAELRALEHAYTRLSALPSRPRLLVAGYFGRLGDALGVLAGTDVEALAVDLVSDERALAEVSTERKLRDKTVVAGLVDGRNVWRTDLRAAVSTAAGLLGSVRDLGVSTSCSLLHVPYDLDAEHDLEEPLRRRLAFAEQKVAEVVTIGRALREGPEAVAGQLSAADEATRVEGRRDDQVRARLAALRPEHRARASFERRADAQRRRLGLPELATTTIGSFPQTGEVRAARAGLRTGRLDAAEYTTAMRTEIERVVRLQEDIGLDVLVHGEPERNDMVQYFAEQLDGYAATEFGWVQSYGSRCVRPPILHGDVSRPRPMTVDWSTYAQSLTDRPVKGMLTGPVTMLAWSFVRADQPLAETADQVALALRDEVSDLERAGLRIIQVDEPALRELLPPRRDRQQEYVEWGVAAFRLATSGVADATQIHTHLCYSEFGDVITAIDALDADVTSLEAARSNMEVVQDLAGIGFGRAVGPGVYDIHSPRVPGSEELRTSLAAAVAALPAERLWVNPDCGLKTRRYPEIEPALRALVDAAKAARQDSATESRR
ncbi:5-methyltetrahydropteroyltriglutamate--homocysteine S-methyltransferase [Prauserella cavernicola]|uniref:5-methyltetrahydropteroyltriglutamate--homocysteine methyltransferase n=1 Tax=Prauserella cavernicola TaxID=2800127 RepID=A0A934V881_9PSEU|nr:5-methyltetrahydropteroyltriglutamate--homocysteine S-methyltransferase [Prauserella cavernicola]MBK1788439.1 5-methyltetrahydropteroyltriglutamate--homocysteine S-methyltransferase [Prauserella cavernicola]